MLSSAPCPSFGPAFTEIYQHMWEPPSLARIFWRKSWLFLACSKDLFMDGGHTSQYTEAIQYEIS